MDPLDDLQKTINCCDHLYQKDAVKNILPNVDDFDFYKNSSDKYTVVYWIDRYKFKYKHINSEQLSFASFTITCDEETLEIFTWSVLQCDLFRMNFSSAPGPLKVASNVANNTIFQKFCADYGFQNDFSQPLELLTILNSFTLGFCVSPETTSPHDLAVFYLKDLLNVPDLETLQTFGHHQ